MVGFLWVWVGTGKWGDKGGGADVGWLGWNWFGVIGFGLMSIWVGLGDVTEP